MKNLHQETRRQGGLLLELAISMTILTIGILGFVNFFAASHRAYRTVQGVDEAQMAILSIAERMRADVFENLYNNYHQRAFEVPTLNSPDQGPAAVLVRCFITESSLPAEFGPVLDIDGNINQVSSTPTTNYRVLPVLFALTYATAQGPQTEELYVVFGQDSAVPSFFY